MSDTTKPITQQGDLAKLPRALAPLIERAAVVHLALGADRERADGKSRPFRRAIRSGMPARATLARGQPTAPR